jgi:hypothetical protein
MHFIDTLFTITNIVGCVELNLFETDLNKNIWLRHFIENFITKKYLLNLSKV